MADIVPFRPRPRPPAEPMIARQQLVTVPRADLEEAAHATLDAAEKLIAILDTLDGDPDIEDGAPEEHRNTIVWFRGTARDLEIDRQEETGP